MQTLEILKRRPPRVERTLAWLNRNRDWPQDFEATIHQGIAFLRTLTIRLARAWH